LGGGFPDDLFHYLAGRWLRVQPVGCSPAAFVTSEQHEHVQSAQFEGRVGSASGAGATVQVVSLTTHDRQFGCRSWSGSYRMTRRASRWLVAGAEIHPRPCTS
jgi:hypothetical protein